MPAPNGSSITTTLPFLSRSFAHGYITEYEPERHVGDQWGHLVQFDDGDAKWYPPGLLAKRPIQLFAPKPPASAAVNPWQQGASFAVPTHLRHPQPQASRLSFSQADVGHRIAVFWPMQGCFYGGVITTFLPASVDGLAAANTATGPDHGSDPRIPPALPRRRKESARFGIHVVFDDGDTRW